MRKKTPPTVSYLVGGLRISIAAKSHTPGPRAHIRGVTDALERAGCKVDIFLASDLPLLRRFKAIREGAGKRSGKTQVILADLVRLAAFGWSGINCYLATRKNKSDLIYERAAVLQALNWFHAGRSKATVVVESNGIMARETAADRNALAFPAVAAILERYLYRRSDLVIVVSSALQRELSAYANIAADRILVVPNAIPEATLAFRRTTVRAGLTLGFTGSLVEWQNLTMLLRAARRSLEMHPGEVTVDIIGDGPEKLKLKQLAAEIQNNRRIRVNFTGPLPQADAYARMASWDAGFAGHQATGGHSMYHSPLKLYEYAGLDIAILATHSADAETLLTDGARIMLFSNENDLTDSIVKLQALRQDAPDETLRQSLYAKHSWDARTSSILQRVQELAVSSND